MVMPSSPLMSQPVSKEELRPGSPPLDEPTPRFVIYMNVTNTVTQILLGGAAFCAFNEINFIGDAEGLYFFQHGYLIIIGYTLLMSQAIFLLNPQSGWANNFKYPKKTKLLWLIQMLGSTLVIIGCFMGVRFVEYSRPHKNHLKSAHAIIGIITMILCFLCMVGGFVRLFTKNKENNSIVNALRACGVTMTLALVSISICLGLFRGHHYILPKNQLDDSTVRMGMALSIITLIAMVFMIVCKMIRSRKIMF